MRLLGLALAVGLLLTGCATTRHGGGQGGGESACSGARSLMPPVAIYGVGAALEERERRN